MSTIIGGAGEHGAASPEPADRNILYVVAIFIALKAGLLGVILLGAQFLPHNASLEGYNAAFPLPGLPDLLRPFYTWDTQHYLLLAMQGYGTNAFSDAFYPLYPFAIRFLTPLFAGNALVAAWAISNVVSLAVPVYMYRLARLFWPARQSLTIVVLLLAFPTAFFLSMAYTEPLFLALCLAAFFHLFKRDVLIASALCFVLPLTRAQALLLLVPILVRFLQTGWGAKGNWREAMRSYLAPALATVAGVGAYLLFCWWQLGDPFAGFNAQRFTISNNSLANLLRPVEWFRANFVGISPILHGYTNSVIDRVAFVIALPLLIGVWRTQHKALAVYGIVTLLVPALSGSFMSYTRHLLLVFPLFMFVGSKVPRAELLAIPMFALQVLLVLMHTGWYWVA